MTYFKGKIQDGMGAPDCQGCFNLSIMVHLLKG